MTLEKYTVWIDGWFSPESQIASKSYVVVAPNWQRAIREATKKFKAENPHKIKRLAGSYINVRVYIQKEVEA